MRLLIGPRGESARGPVSPRAVYTYTLTNIVVYTNIELSCVRFYVRT